VKFGSYSWWIAVILGFESGGCGTIGDHDGFELGYSVVFRREIGTRRATKKSRSLLLWLSKFS